MNKFLMLVSFSLFFSCQNSNKITIGYQLMANPWKYLISSGKLDKIAGKEVEFKKFNSGAKVINAMASGDVDIAIAGSTPIAAGLSQGLDIQLLWVMEIIGEAEALVVKNDINSISDLKGKKVAVPFGSTTHFHLMLAFKEANINPKDVTILNLSPPSIVASWKKNEISAAFVWSPALEEIQTGGKVILNSKDMSEKGNPTFDGIIVNKSFLAQNKGFVKAFLNTLIENHQDYNLNPWDKTNEKVIAIANFVGSSPNKVAKTLKGYIFPNKSNHPTKDLGAILKNTAIFLKEQGKIESVLETYEDKIALDIIKSL